MQPARISAHLVLPDQQRVDKGRQPRLVLGTMKRLIRQFLDERPKSIVFVPILYFPPTMTDAVIIHIQGVRNISALKDCHVNGVACKSFGVHTAGGNAFLICSPGLFLQHENVVAFPPGVGAWNVFLYPCHSRHLLQYHQRHLRDFRLEVAPGFALPSGKPIAAIAPPPGEQGQASPTEAAVDYLLRSQIKTPGGRYNGTYHCAFDLDAQAYRLTSWIWTSGIVVKALAGERCFSQHAARIDTSLLAARDALLGLQIKEGKNHGGYEVRWDVTRAEPSGILRWIAPNDAAMLGSQGLMTMHALFPDGRCLEAAQNIARWIMDSCTRPDGLVYVGCDSRTNRWNSDWLYVDCAFTTTLFRDLYNHSHDFAYAHWIRTFIEAFVRAFIRPDGLFNAFSGDMRVRKDHVFTRGQAWALDGLLSAHEVAPDAELLKIAGGTLHRLQETQNPDGSWYYSLLSPESGKDAKAVPIIACQALRLHELHPQEWLVELARKALDWCTAQQVPAHVPFAGGGIGSYTSEGAITGKTSASIIFSYSVAYYLLAARQLENVTGTRPR